MTTLFDLRKEKERKDRRDISIAEIARQLRLSNKSRYWLMEHGEVEPKTSELIKIANYFQVTVDVAAQAVRQTIIERATRQDEKHAANG